MFKWEVDPIQEPPPVKGRATPEGAPPEAREDPTLAAKRRFFEWLAEPLTRMSKELDVPRDLLFNMAAKEGGWTKPDLDHRCAGGRPSLELSVPGRAGRAPSTCWSEPQVRPTEALGTRPAHFPSRDGRNRIVHTETV